MVEPVCDIDVHDHQGLTHVVLAGEIDAANAATIGAQISEYLGVSTTALVVDLAAVTLLSSTGIAMLVACHSRARNAGVPFGVIGAQGRIRGILDLTGVLEYLNIDAVVLPPALHPTPHPA